MQSNATQRNMWAQLGVSACALLLPAMVLGAAVYSLLPSRDGSAGRPAAGGGAGADAAAFKSRFSTLQPPPVGAGPQAVTQASEPVPVMRNPAPAETRGSASATGVRHEPVGKPAKDIARVSDPVPVEVTAAAAPAGVNPPQPADVDSGPTGSVDVEPPWPAVPEVSMTLLPRALAPPVQAPPRPPPQMPAAQMPAAQIPAAQAPPASAPRSAEGPPASPVAHKRARPSYLETLARRNGARADARSETHAPRRNTQPQPQQPFSLKNWLQQLGNRPRDTGG